MTTVVKDRLTLPEVSLEYQVGLDRLRRFARRPEVAALFTWTGPFRTIAVADIPKLMEIVRRPIPVRFV